MGAKKAKKGDGAVRPEDVQGGECHASCGRRGGREGGMHTHDTLHPLRFIRLTGLSFDDMQKIAKHSGGYVHWSMGLGHTPIRYPPLLPPSLPPSLPPLTCFYYRKKEMDPFEMLKAMDMDLGDIDMKAMVEEAMKVRTPPSLPPSLPPLLQPI